MQTLAIKSGMLVIAVSLAGCNTFSGKEIGGASGVVLGGVAGSALSGGNAAATIGGSLVGGVIGYKAGENHDQKHPRTTINK